MEYLVQNGLSTNVVNNYLSAIRHKCKLLNIKNTGLYDPRIMLYQKSLTINRQHTPKFKGVFDLQTLQKISKACNCLILPELYRTVFLFAYFGFIRISNLTPSSVATFDSTRHFTRADIIFQPPGIHLIQRWSKTNQTRANPHIIQLPSLNNTWLCPVRAANSLLQKYPLPQSYPLLACPKLGGKCITDTMLRATLKHILIQIGHPTTGYSFHCFRRSGATLAFNSNIQLQHIQKHGDWKSDAIWAYLENTSHSTSIIPATFSAIIPPLL